MSILKAILKETMDEEIAQIIKDKLLLKYNEEFDVVKIGRRFGASSSNDTVTTFCRSVNNADLLFTSVLNVDKVHFEDDYYLNLVCFELQKEIKNALEMNKIESYPRVFIIGLYELDKKLNLVEFIEKEEGTNFLIRLYIKDKVEFKKIRKAIETVKEKYPGIDMRGDIILLNADSYDEYANIFKGIPDSEDYSVDSNTIIEKYRIEGI